MVKQLKCIVQDYDSSDIFNADETGFFFRMLPDKTLQIKGVESKGDTYIKERLTVLVSFDMVG